MKSNQKYSRRKAAMKRVVKRYTTRVNRRNNKSSLAMAGEDFIDSRRESLEYILD